MRKCIKMVALSVIVFTYICGTAFAMSMNKSVYIGGIYQNNTCGLHVENAFFNKGDRYTWAPQDPALTCSQNYTRGVAKFGNKRYPLYVQYDKKSEMYKISDEKLSKIYNVHFAGEGGIGIHSVKNDMGMTMYLVTCGGLHAGTVNFILFAYRPDGKFVKYIDTGDTRVAFWGSRTISPSLKGVYLSGAIKIEDDKVIVSYRKYNSRNKASSGEIIYKWDEAAQWFSVEVMDH